MAFDQVYINSCLLSLQNLLAVYVRVNFNWQDKKSWMRDKHNVSEVYTQQHKVSVLYGSLPLQVRLHGRSEKT